MQAQADTLEESVALLTEYSRLENFRYCARELQILQYERRLERCFEQRSSMRGVLEETFEVLHHVYNIFDVAHVICACVKKLIQQRWYKLPNSYWPSTHVAVPRLTFHTVRR